MSTYKCIKCDHCDRTELANNLLSLWVLLKDSGWIKKIINGHIYHFCDEECFKKYLNIKDRK